jgi:hypothetical protein
MGQGYVAIILASKQGPKEIIRTWINPHEYNNGYKLMEHSYIRNQFVQAVESLIRPEGIFYKSRLVWAGDYADNEEGLDENLNTLCFNKTNEGKISYPARSDMSSYRYIVNHTKNQYVIKNAYSIHPLPLLTVEGNGRGGGDYMGGDELVGTWARDIISVEQECPVGYSELVCEFSE